MAGRLQGDRGPPRGPAPPLTRGPRSRSRPASPLAVRRPRGRSWAARAGLRPIRQPEREDRQLDVPRRGERDPRRLVLDAAQSGVLLRLPGWLVRPHRRPHPPPRLGGAGAPGLSRAGLPRVRRAVREQGGVRRPPAPACARRSGRALRARRVVPDALPAPLVGRRRGAARRARIRRRPVVEALRRARPQRGARGNRRARRALRLHPRVGDAPTALVGRNRWARGRAGARPLRLRLRDPARAPRRGARARPGTRATRAPRRGRRGGRRSRGPVARVDRPRRRSADDAGVGRGVQPDPRGERRRTRSQLGRRRGRPAVPRSHGRSACARAVGG